MKNKNLLIVILAIILLAALYYVSISFSPTPQVEETLPDQNDNLIATTTAEGVTFSYPAFLGTTYIAAIDWPPQVQVTTGPFACNEAGTVTDRAGKTQNVVIGGRTYCVTKVGEGAAGSTYIQYAYASVKDGKVPILTFSTREVQCLNYDEPQQTACLDERTAFDPDSLADQIMQSMTFN